MHMSRNKAGALSGALIAAGLVFTIAGCSSGASGPHHTLVAESSTATADDSASESVDTLPSSSPATTSATGQQFTIRDIATFRVTDGVEWVSNGDKTTTISAETFDIPDGADGFVQLSASQFPQITDNFERMAEQALIDQQARLDVTLERIDDREIGGVMGYVLTGGGDRGQIYEWGGLDENNVLTVFTFVIPEGADVEEWVEPILASIEWM